MFVDSRPSRTYGETQAWDLPFALSIGPSPFEPRLSHMDSAIPSFRGFVSRTPPPQFETPGIDPQGKAALRSRASISSRSSRRTSTSSIYSEYQGSPAPRSDASWNSVDLEDQHNILLRSIVYDSTTPALARRLSIPMLLQPRTYSPFALAADPSPPHVKKSPPSHPPIKESRPSVLLPPAPVSVRIPKKHLRTVSLEKARETSHKQQIHMLPEELRAQDLQSARAHLRTLHSPNISKVDFELVSSTPKPSVESQESSTAKRQKALPIEGTFHVGSGPVRHMMPLAQMRETSTGKIVRALGLGDKEERPAQAAPSKTSQTESYRRSDGWTSSSSLSSSEGMTDRQKVAREYHAVLTNVVKDSTSISHHIKLAPMPLFHGRCTPVDTLLQGSPKQTRSRTASPDRWDESIDHGFRPGDQDTSSFPTEVVAKSRSSTSGSIPISPPFPHPAPCLLTNFTPLYASPYEGSWTKSAFETGSVASRDHNDMNGTGTEFRDRPIQFGTQQSDYMLTEDIIAEYLRTPSGSPSSSLQFRSLHKIDYSDGASNYSDPEDRDDGSEHYRTTQSVTASPRTRPSGSPHRPATSSRKRRPTDVASPDSPHLYPSPSIARTMSPLGLHLGWSEKAKQSFDKARSTVGPKHRSIEIEHLTHDRKDMEQVLHSHVGAAPESSASGTRRSIAFGGLIEGWIKETKAQKRRKDLKKIIRHVPNGGAAVKGDR